MALPATDNFNRADANPIGGNWTAGPSDAALQIVSNVAVGAGGATQNTAYWNADSFNDNQYSQAKCTTGGTTIPYVIVRRNTSSGQTHYFAGVYSTSIVRVKKRVTGTVTQLGSDFSVTISSSDVLKLSVSGSTLSLYINGSSQGTRDDTAIASGAPGIGMYSNTGNSLDDWEGGDVTSGYVPYPFSRGARGGMAVMSGGLQ